MAGTQSAVNLQIANLSVGFSIGGGTSLRTLTVNGTGNPTLTSQQTIVLTLPNRATDTVVGYGDYSAKGVILVGTGAGTFTALSVGTNGYILTANSATASGVNWAVNDATAAGVTSWVDVTTGTQAMADNTGYYADNSSGSVAFTLPLLAAQFDFMEIVGIQTGWTLAQNALQSIIFGNIQTTVGIGGSLASTNAHDSIKLQCTVANTTWTVRDAIGNIAYV